MRRRYSKIMLCWIFGIYLAFPLTSAQRRRQTPPDKFENTADTPFHKHRERKEKIRKQIVDSTGTTTWDGIGEDDRLRSFGIPHHNNRRNLKVQKRFTFFDTNDDLILNTTAALRSSNSPMLNPKNPAARKGSKKGFGKGGGGMVYFPSPYYSPSYPYPPPGHYGGQPISRPTYMPRPNDWPTSPPNHLPATRPTLRPVPPPNQPTPPSDNSCKVEVDLNFLQFSAIPPAILVNNNEQSDQVLGTRYVYNDGLRDPATLDELTNSTGSGTCTRIQARIGDPAIGLQLGQGHCTFTYSFSDARNRQISFTATGVIADSLGGILAITGGSHAAVGAYGEIELLPVQLLSDGSFEVETGDIFLDPIFYRTDGKLYIPCASS